MRSKTLILSFLYILMFAFLVLQIKNAVISFYVMGYGIMSVCLWNAYIFDEAKERGGKQ